MKQSLHEKIRADFEARILAGVLAPGDRLPTEQELMQTHGCSRMTVNKALSALQSAGLIDRRKKAGSFVARPRVHSMVLDIPDLAEQIAGRGQAHSYRLLRREVRGPAASLEQEVILANGAMLLELDGIHYADGHSLAVEHRLIAIRAVPAIVDVDLDAISPGAWLLRHVPWTEAENRISAVGASREEATRLAIAPGAPCLCVERHTWRGGDPITYVRQVFLADSYDMVARFGPSGSAASAVVASDDGTS